MIYKHMDYIPFDLKNPHCLHVMISNRAYCSIINETFEHGTDETGGLLLGYIIGRKWYVVEVIDPGTNNTIHQTGLFQWDQDYVNQIASRMRNLYRYQPTILGFWHRHPGNMDYFSQQDVETTQKNLQGARKGLISMLVNIDPALRMTFYYCNGPHFMPVRYDVGDEYFPVELLEYATPDMISQRHVNNQRGQAVDISYRRILQPPTVPGLEPKKSVRADNDILSENGIGREMNPPVSSDKSTQVTVQQSSSEAKVLGYPVGAVKNEQPVVEVLEGEQVAIEENKEKVQKQENGTHDGEIDVDNSVTPNQTSSENGTEITPSDVNNDENGAKRKGSLDKIVTSVTNLFTKKEGNNHEQRSS